MSDITEMDVVVAPEAEEAVSYVDWPAIIGGIVLASAISLLLLTFGSALGLSFVDFRAAKDVLPLWVAIAAGLWLLWVQVSSFMAGAYLTGRLRRRHYDATEHEVDVRDGAHGLLVWAGALVVGALIATGGLSALASTVGSAASTLTNAASNVAGDAAKAADPNAYFVDMLFRPAPDAAPAAAGTDTSAQRAEAGRIVAQGALTGSVSDSDKAYLGQLVSQTTDMPVDQANTRVGEVMTAVDNAKAEADRVAENARRTGVVAAFLTAAALLVSAAGAYWAAQKGGNHRDSGTAFPGVFRRY
ncbi:MAG: hypothetical protein ACTHLT_05400 [Devosia sp.]